MGYQQDPRFAKLLTDFRKACPWWQVGRDSFNIDINYFTKHVIIEVTAPTATAAQFKVAVDYLQELILGKVT